MEKKKILIYAHYYFPDVASTGQILQDIAENMTNEFDVTVICTVPSYTGVIGSEYKEKKFYIEIINGVKIVRVPVPEYKKSNKISRIKNLIAYYLGAKKATRLLCSQDYVFTISQPPIMGGMLGVYGKKKFKAKFIYCIQDFNPEQAMVTGYINKKQLLKVALWIDMRSCKKADLIITVGHDLVETLKYRFAGKSMPRYTMINNWVDEKKIYPLSSEHPQVVEFRKKYGLIGKFVIMYSGNIGLYYDFEGLIKIIKEFKISRTPDGRDVVFVFVGDGIVLGKLINYKEKNNLSNVIFIPYQNKDNLINSLNAADVHWCMNAKGIKGISCPSKFYGIASVGKPVLGVMEEGSEIQMLINQIGCGKCSEPGDYDTVRENIRWFINNSNNCLLKEMGMRGHNYLINHLTKNMSIERYIKAIKEL